MAWYTATSSTTLIARIIALSSPNGGPTRAALMALGRTVLRLMLDWSLA